MTNFFLLLYLVPLVVCDTCVKYTFENGFEELFTQGSNICAGLSTWNIGRYNDTYVTNQNELSTQFIYPGETSSCVASFEFAMRPGGTIEINSYMSNVNNHALIHVLVMQRVDENVSDRILGQMHHTPTLGTNFVAGWNTMTLTLSGEDTEEYIGYLAINGGAPLASTVLIDSFRYIPPDMNKDECTLYALDLTDTTTEPTAETTSNPTEVTTTYIEFDTTTNSENEDDTTPESNTQSTFESTPSTATETTTEMVTEVTDGDTDSNTEIIQTPQEPPNTVTETNPELTTAITTEDYNNSTTDFSTPVPMVPFITTTLGDINTTQNIQSTQELSTNVTGTIPDLTTVMTTEAYNSTTAFSTPVTMVPNITTTLGDIGSTTQNIQSTQELFTNATGTIPELATEMTTEAYNSTTAFSTPVTMVPNITTTLGDIGSTTQNIQSTQELATNATGTIPELTTEMTTEAYNSTTTFSTPVTMAPNITTTLSDMDSTTQIFENTTTPGITTTGMTPLTTTDYTTESTVDYTTEATTERPYEITQIPNQLYNIIAQNSRIFVCPHCTFN